MPVHMSLGQSMILLVLLVPCVQAETLHVRKSGDDTNPGTAEAPFLTIRRAAELGQPGDTVLVHEGVYRERVIPARGGEENHPITYAAAPRENVVIRASEIFAPNWERRADGVFHGAFADDFFPASGVGWETAPANDFKSGGGAVRGDSGGGVDRARTEFLGTFDMENTDYVLSHNPGHAVEFNDQKLADFLNADTNGIATLILTRAVGKGNLMGAFASKENDGKPGPVLELTVSKDGGTKTVVISTADGRGADAHVESKTGANHGDAPSLWSVQSGTKRKTWLRFDLSNVEGTVQSATLKLAVVHPTGQGEQTHNVFGLKDGDKGEAWNETSAGAPGWRNPYLTPLKAARDDMSLTLGQVFVNGQRLTEFDTEEAVQKTPGSWKADSEAKGLLIHFPEGVDDPIDEMVEVTVRNRIFAPHLRGLGHIYVRGFVMEHCANQFPSGFWSSDSPQAGALGCRGGHHWVIEGNTIRHAKAIGLDCGSEGDCDLEGDQPEPTVVGHHLIRGNVISDNGACGIAGYRSLRTQIIGNTIERNNCLHFQAPETGGIKTHFLIGGLVAGNVLRDNDCSGIWLDNVYAHTRVTRNVILNSRSKGVFTEMGGGPVLIDNNIIGGTRPGFYSPDPGGDGMYGHDSSGVTFVHNLVFGNSQFGIHFRKLTGRSHSVYPKDIQDWNTEAIDRKPCVSSNHVIMGNVVLNNRSGSINLPYPGPEGENNKSDYNVFTAGGRFVASKRGGIPTEEILKQCEAKLGKQPGIWWGGSGVWLSPRDWQKLMALDEDSLWTKEGAVEVDEDLNLTWTMSNEVLSVQVPLIKDVDGDFFGAPRKDSRAPGPFPLHKTGKAQWKLSNAVGAASEEPSG